MKKSKLPIILLIGVLLIALDYWYFKIYKKEEPTVNPTPIIDNISNNEQETTNCDEGYKCDTVNNIEYKWTIKKSLMIKDMYNVDNSQMEAGTLAIDEEGKLNFLDLENKVLRSYTELDGKAISIEETIDSCDEEEMYLVLTDNGSIFRSDAHNGLLIEEAFYKITSDSKFIDFMVKRNDLDYECIVNEIYAKTEEGTIVKMLSNENLAQ